MTRRFHSDSRQQLEAIPKHEQTTGTPATANLCLVFAIHQIQALAMGGQLLHTICTETEAQAAHTALVHEILSALCSTLVRKLEQAFTVDCFDHIALLMPLLAPAAS